MSLRSAAPLCVTLLLCGLPAGAQAPAKPSVPTQASAAVSLTFNSEALGTPAQDFDAVVGDWSISEAGGERGLKVDGARWRQGTPSVNLADQARRLYGERYAEFLDGVRAFAFFPLAVYRAASYSGDLRLSVRFYPMAGRIDQGAGIAFAIAPDGSYLGVRANALEDNLLFFRVVRGKRTILENVRGVATPTRTWHQLVVTLRGKQMTAELDGTQRLKRTLELPPQGRVGLWSKADSQVLFDNFEIKPLP